MECGSLLIPRIERACSIRDLAAVRALLPRTTASLLASGVSAEGVGQILAETNDLLTRRLLDLAQAELGAPPSPFCWLTMGSEGRREQSLYTDQDNGLIFSDHSPADADTYFARMAEWMVSALEACGARRCQGDVMATNPTWRGPLAAWRDRFASWIHEPRPEAILRALIGFDFRGVAGDVSLATDLRAWLINCTPGPRRFLAHLATAALSRRPPLRLLGGFAVPRRGADAGLLDLKRRVLTPMVDAARVLALEHGIASTSTLARLDEAGAAGALSAEDARDMRAAFVGVQALRMQRQLADVAAGRPLSNAVAPGCLPPADQTVLRRHLRALGRVQSVLRIRYAVELMGA